MLSNVDIVKELGKNILIFPFNELNLKGASYNLTPSKYAWTLTTKQRVYDQSREIITLESRSTTVIETVESIWVSKKIAGTYHSKVILVSKGIGHIGTTLDPEYIGCSLIAIHNVSDEIIELDIKDTFVSIVFEYVHEASTIDRHNNESGRLQIFSELGINLTNEERRELQKDFMIDPKALRIELSKSQNFKDIKAKYTSGYIYILKKYSASILSIVLIIILFWINNNQSNFKNKGWYNTSQSVIPILLTVFMTLAGKQLIDDING